ncbi:MAG: type II secretion system protein GspG [Pseudobdellovibrionaceae bacterium]
MKSILVFLTFCGISLATVMASAKTESNVEKAKEVAQQVENALDMFFVDCHEFPRSLKELLKAPRNCKFWGPDPYLKTIPADPWGHEWHYSRIDQNNFEMKSFGADDKEGGEGLNADIVVKGTAPKVSKGTEK